jgi:hypothetical protein
MFISKELGSCYKPVGETAAAVSDERKKQCAACGLRINDDPYEYEKSFHRELRAHARSATVVDWIEYAMRVDNLLAVAECMPSTGTAKTVDDKVSVRTNSQSVAGSGLCRLPVPPNPSSRASHGP